MADTHKVGLDIRVKDGLSTALKSWDKKLQTVHQKLGQLVTGFGHVNTAGLKAFGQQMAAAAKVLQAAQGTQRVQGQTAGQAAKASAQAIKDDLMHKKITAEIAGINQKSANMQLKVEKELHILKLKGHDLNRKANHDYERHQMAVIRFQQQQLRLQERINEKARHTDDVRYLENMRSNLPSKGNMIAPGLAMMGAGTGIINNIIQLGNSDPVKEALHARSTFGAFNLSDADNNKAMAGAASLRQQVRGLDVAASIEVVKDLFNVLRDVGEATDPQLMKKAGQFFATNKAAAGLGEAQMQAAVKAADMLIMDDPRWKHMNPEAVKRERAGQFMGNLETVNKMFEGSGYRLDPAQVRNFLAFTRTQRFGMTNAGLMGMEGVMLEKGGAQTGTMLSALANNLAAGRNPAKANAALVASGLLDRNRVVAGKGGGYTTKIGGALVDQDLFFADPRAWSNKHIEPLLAGKSTSEAKGLIQSWVGRNTAADLLATFHFQRMTLEREMHGTMATRGIGEADAAQQGTALRAQQNYAAAVRTLQADLGLIVLPTLTRWTMRFTDVLMAINAAVEKHPTATKGLLGLGVVAGGLVAIAGALVTLKGAVAAWKAINVIAGAAPGAGAAAGNAAANIAGGAAGGLLARLFPTFAKGGAAIAAGVGRMFGGVAGAAVRIASVDVMAAAASMGAALGQAGTAAAGVIQRALLLVLSPSGAAVIAAGGLGLAIGYAIGRAIENSGFMQSIQKKIAEWLSGVSADVEGNYNNDARNLRHSFGNRTAGGHDNVGKHALGGITRRASLGWIGEAGPEAILPLTGNTLGKLAMMIHAAGAQGNRIASSFRGGGGSLGATSGRPTLDVNVSGDLTVTGSGEFSLAAAQTIARKAGRRLEETVLANLTSGHRGTGTPGPRFGTA